MARPLRLEFHGALYHVTSRGDGQEDIYLDDDDRATCVDVLESVVKRFNWTVHAYCVERQITIVFFPKLAVVGY